MCGFSVSKTRHKTTMIVAVLYHLATITGNCVESTKNSESFYTFRGISHQFTWYLQKELATDSNLQNHHGIFNSISIRDEDEISSYKFRRTSRTWHHVDIIALGKCLSYLCRIAKFLGNKLLHVFPFNLGESVAARQWILQHTQLGSALDLQIACSGKYYDVKDTTEPFQERLRQSIKNSRKYLTS